MVLQGSEQPSDWCKREKATLPIAKKLTKQNQATTAYCSSIIQPVICAVNDSRRRDRPQTHQNTSIKPSVLARDASKTSLSYSRIILSHSQRCIPSYRFIRELRFNKPEIFVPFHDRWHASRCKCCHVSLWQNERALLLRLAARAYGCLRLAKCFR